MLIFEQILLAIILLLLCSTVCTAQQGECVRYYSLICAQFHKFRLSNEMHLSGLVQRHRVNCVWTWTAPVFYLLCFALPWFVTRIVTSNLELKFTMLTPWFLVKNHNIMLPEFIKGGHVSPAVAEHAMDTGHSITFKWTEVCILDSYPCLQQRCTLESWHILQQPNPINRNPGLLPPVYHHVIHAHACTWPPLFMRECICTTTAIEISFVSMFVVWCLHVCIICNWRRSL